ncbi:septation protein SpoVG family protein [Thermocrinis jamiesonii]|uniref:septation protein SpoVG family protein n=1 Tax=Thermocrinis jamiesonii TaxID=1302351 RepID=UPI00049746AD|nr:septation protein SpoVG family protein [Thermocrinis jamiesonii]
MKNTTNSKDSTPEVELLKFYPFEVSTKKPRLLAYADVRVDQIVIRGIKLFQAKNGGLFIQLPTVNFDGKDYPVIEVKSKTLLDRIRREVVDYYKALEDA